MAIGQDCSAPEEVTVYKWVHLNPQMRRCMMLNTADSMVTTRPTDQTVMHVNQSSQLEKPNKLYHYFTKMHNRVNEINIFRQITGTNYLKRKFILPLNDHRLPVSKNIKQNNSNRCKTISNTTYKL